jgi:hypothetical protein
MLTATTVASLRRCRVSCSFLLLFVLLMLLRDASLVSRCAAQLEPGEIRAADNSAATPQQQLEQLPEPSPNGKLCDAELSRKARVIVDELLLSTLPSGFVLPDSCPFHPSYDVLAAWEPSAVGTTAAASAAALAAAGARPGPPGKTRQSGGVWQCDGCSKRFSSERHLDRHILSRHIDTDPSSFVCLADYCDVLDCYHRSVRIDPLSGQVHQDSSNSHRRGGMGEDALSRVAGMRLSNQAGGRGLGTGLAARMAIEAAKGSAAAPVLQDPTARRCSPAAMELVKLRCENALLQCFPFPGSSSAGAAVNPDTVTAVQPTLSAEEVHSLYEQAHESLCAPLHCTADGSYANAAGVVSARADAARTRLYLVLLSVLLAALVLFYACVVLLRGEFGLRKPTTQRGGGHSALSQAYKGRTPNGVERWIGGHIKRNANKLI